ncbi:MAG: SRPBCC family protein [Planctomycetota bacterium]
MSAQPAPPVELRDTHGVFHDRALYERELATLFAGGWFCAGTRDELERGELVHPVGPWRYHVTPGDPLRAWREDEPQRALPAEARGPYVFVCGAAPPPQPLSEALGPQAEVLERLGALARGFLFEVRQEIPANWKLVVSGAIEDYHVPHVHGRSVNPWRRDPAPPLLHPGGHSSYGTSAAGGLGPRLIHRVVAGAAPVTQDFENHLVYPNLLTIRLWGLVHVTTLTPLARDLTLRRTRIYEHDPPSGWSPRRPLRALTARVLRELMSVTFREDLAIAIEAQAGTSISQSRRRGPAHAEEARVEHFLAETWRRANRAGE